MTSRVTAMMIGSTMIDEGPQRVGDESHDGP